MPYTYTEKCNAVRNYWQLSDIDIAELDDRIFVLIVEFDGLREVLHDCREYSWVLREYRSDPEFRKRMTDDQVDQFAEGLRKSSRFARDLRTTIELGRDHIEACDGEANITARKLRRALRRVLMLTAFDALEVMLKNDPGNFAPDISPVSEELRRRGGAPRLPTSAPWNVADPDHGRRTRCWSDDWQRIKDACGDMPFTLCDENSPGDCMFDSPFSMAIRKTLKASGRGDWFDDPPGRMATINGREVELCGVHDAYVPEFGRGGGFTYELCELLITAIGAWSDGYRVDVFERIRDRAA